MSSPNGTVVRPQLYHDGQVYCDFLYNMRGCAEEEFHTGLLLVCIPLSLVAFVLGTTFLAYKIGYKVLPPSLPLSSLISIISPIYLSSHLSSRSVTPSHSSALNPLFTYRPFSYSPPLVHPSRR